MCLLRELYGAGVEKLRIEHQTVVVSDLSKYAYQLMFDPLRLQGHVIVFPFHSTGQAPSKKKIEINTIASNYHLEVNPR